jgi:hypothetical protein
MANSGLSGPYALTAENVDYFIKYKSPGSYALGYTDNNGTYIIKYVGRSDDDVNYRLKSWVGKYQRFKFGYFDSPKASFEKECYLYHDFGGDKGQLDNEIHPQRPENTNWSCPVCTIFD